MGRVCISGDGAGAGSDVILKSFSLTFPWYCFIHTFRKRQESVREHLGTDWHSAVEKEGNSSVDPDAEKTFYYPHYFFRRMWYILNQRFC